MREQLEQRRAELQAEHKQGAAMLAEIDQKRVELAQTLLRISGAVQVLDELLAQQPAEVEGEQNGVDN